MDPLDICIFGAGAVGGSLAVRLSAGGARLSVVARGEHAEAIRRNGLTLVSGLERRTARVWCPEELSCIAPQDVVIVTLKWPSVPAAAPAFSALLKPHGLIVFAMNGIPWWFAHARPDGGSAQQLGTLDPGGVLARSVPANSIVGAVVRSSNEVVSPGVIVNTTPGQNALTLGLPSGLRTPLLESLAAVLRAAGYATEVTDSIREEIWAKNLLAASAGPVAALTGATLGELVDAPETRSILEAVMTEGITVGRTFGLHLTEDVHARLDGFKGKPVRPSMLQDFESGRPAEIENAILAVVVMADALGVAVPVTSLVAALIRMKKVSASAGR
jgi:2-dehydropantoate 2-reductase